MLDVLTSEFLTQGPRVPDFEARLSRAVGSRYAVAANSATSSLHLACLALGVSSGDIVWTSAVTFVASANCAEYCGATVDFVDIHPESNNIDPKALRLKLEAAEQENKLPKVVIVVHLAGLPCDLSEISDLSAEFGFRIIEDASHALGAEYKGTKIGSCVYSDITVFSFHPVKIITTGEGGAATTNSQELSAKMARLRSHGVTRDPSEMSQVDGPWYYEQIELGFNYRLTDFQAALGSSQLERLSDFIESRNKIAQTYFELLVDMGLILPEVPNDRLSAFHLFILRVTNEFKSSRNSVFEKLRSEGVNVNLHYIPVYRQPYFKKKYNFNPSDYPESERYYEEAISIPMFPSLSRQEIGFVAESIRGQLGHQTIF